jgi:phospholipase/lecithinase/hemolysin
MSFCHVKKKPASCRRASQRTIFPALCLALCLAATTGRAFTAFYVFGDSLSDTGRNPPASTNYYDGRYSNGPLWVEYLSAQLGLSYNPSNNFAVSGSTTSDLLSQIAGLTGFTNLQSGLFTVDSGGNDFLQASVSLGVNDAAWAMVVSNAVFNVTNAVEALYNDNAREILVGNLANIGQTPAFNTAPAGYGSYVDTKVALFNTQLVSALTNLRQHNPGLRIYLLDNNHELSVVLNSPATYGFTVTTNGALEDPNLTDKSFTGPGADYVFWDTIHPTTKLDAMTGAAAFDLVAVQLKLAGNGTNLNLALGNLYPTLPYTIQTSSNLVTWSNDSTFTATNTNATVTVTNGSGKNLFYRVSY